jgi:L-ascorbate metabolism protein UlaG (beta-lactamase superfamily)
MGSTVTIDEIEFTSYVQATFKVKGDGKTIWIDPHRLSKDTVGKDAADIVMVTHPHADHMDPGALKACLKSDSVLVTNPTVASQLEGSLAGEVASGLQILRLAAGQSTEQKGVPIQAVAGYNTYHPRREGFNTGFLFTLAGQKIFHAGDTDNVPEFLGLAVDIALYPIGGTYTSDEVDAARAIKAMGARFAIPMHYGYPTGGYPEKFRLLVEPAAEVRVLEPVLDVRFGS